MQLAVDIQFGGGHFGVGAGVEQHGDGRRVAGDDGRMRGAGNGGGGAGWSLRGHGSGEGHGQKRETEGDADSAIDTPCAECSLAHGCLLLDKDKRPDAAAKPSVC
jgi:hypothetical protein